MNIGYTTGVFDLFHVGHVNLLRNAKSMCDKLIVGVTTDELVGYKFKKSVIPFEERIEIVRCCSFVDAAIPQENIDKYLAWEKIKFNTIFVGDDWFNQDRWQELEKKFNSAGVRIIYFPYTKGTSSTLINETLQSIRLS
jgi:glycerol-3-phosphate cytidylyltransferase